MILKFQQGGLAPLVSYEPVTVAGPASTSATSSSGSTSQDLTSKDLYKMIDKLDGLPSDIGLIFQKLRNFEWNQDNNPFNTTDIETQYLSILNDLKVANFNKKEYDNAFEIIKANGGINELAISDRGMLYCMNQENNDLKLLSIDKLKDNPNYVALTNGELLNLRSQNPELANQNNILRVVQNGIGIETVTKYISDTISSLGSDKHVQSGFGVTPKGAVITGLQDFLQQAQQAPQGFNGTIQDLYKYKQLTESQAKQAKMAIEYLYRTMPQNMKTLLKTKTQGGTDKEALEYIQQLISSKVSNTSEFDIDSETSSSKKDGASKSKNDDKINPAVAFQLDMGVETTIPIISGSTDALKIQAYRMPVTTKEGKPLGVTTLDKISNESALGGIFDFSHVTMGDQVLDMASSMNVVVDGSSIYKAYLPIDQTQAAKGIITPNLNYLNLLEKVRREINESGAQTPEEINAIYEANNLPQFVTASGQVNEEFYKPFGVLNATALSDAFPTTVDLNNNRNFEEIDDDNEINNYWSIIKGKDTKEEFDEKAWYNDIFGDYQQMFKGLIYLPLNSTDPTLGAYSGGDTPSYSTLNDYRARWQQDQKLNSYNNPGQLQL